MIIPWGMTIEDLNSLERAQFVAATRFGIGCLGSRLMAGVLNASAGESLIDKEGKTLNEIRRATRFVGPLSDVTLSPGHYSAFVELHIEQGPLLEEAV